MKSEALLFSRLIKILKSVKYFMIFVGIVFGGLMTVLQLSTIGRNTKTVAPEEYEAGTSNDNGSVFQYSTATTQEEKTKNNYI